jgi:ABC-type phosphonate transport system ATPase subunit
MSSVFFLTAAFPAALLATGAGAAGSGEGGERHACVSEGVASAHGHWHLPWAWSVAESGTSNRRSIVRRLGCAWAIVGRDAMDGLRFAPVIGGGDGGGRGAAGVGRA